MEAPGSPTTSVPPHATTAKKKRCGKHCSGKSTDSFTSKAWSTIRERAAKSARGETKVDTFPACKVRGRSQYGCCHCVVRLSWRCRTESSQAFGGTDELVPTVQTTSGIADIATRDRRRVRPSACRTRKSSCLPRRCAVTVACGRRIRARADVVAVQESIEGLQLSLGRHCLWETSRWIERQSRADAFKPSAPPLVTKQSSAKLSSDIGDHCTQ